MPPIYTFDAESMRLIAEQVRQMKQRLRSLEADARTHQRRRASTGTSFKRGKPKADIAGDSTGTVVIWDETGATTTEEEAFNPYTITLMTDEFVRLGKVGGWAKQLCWPDQYIDCDEPPPLPVGPVVS